MAPLFRVLLFSATFLVGNLAENTKPDSFQIPFPFPQQFSAHQLKLCLLSLPSIAGFCIEDIVRYVKGPQDGIINLQCCTAVRTIVKECQLASFPFNPIFPPLVLGVCV